MLQSDGPENTLTPSKKYWTMTYFVRVEINFLMGQKGTLQLGDDETPYAKNSKGFRKLQKHIS